jgi:SAM-dependent methyltransferase
LVDRPPELWERGCRTDEIRNSFVVPTLVGIIGRSRPNSVVDIGCGTGYITREVAAQVGPLKPDWRLLDHAPDMLEFAEEMAIPSGRVQYFLHDLTTSPLGQVPVSDLGFLAYTLLDFPLNDEMTHNIAALIAPIGRLIVFLPDVLEDVVERAKEEPGIMDQYIEGHCSLAKKDKFTARNVLFEANRVEYVISMFLETGMFLTKVDRYESSKRKTHHALEFKKMD